MTILVVFLMLHKPCDVEYRLAPEYKVKIFDDYEAAYEFEGFLYFLHCESHIRPHGERYKVEYKRRRWRKIKFVNFIKAKRFDEILKKLEFETRITFAKCQN